MILRFVHSTRTELNSTPRTQAQNSLNTNRPSFVAAGTRMASERFVYLGRPVAGQFSSVDFMCCELSFLLPTNSGKCLENPSVLSYAVRRPQMGMGSFFFTQPNPTYQLMDQIQPNPRC